MAGCIWLKYVLFYTSGLIFANLLFYYFRSNLSKFQYEYIVGKTYSFPLNHLFNRLFQLHTYVCRVGDGIVHTRDILAI